MDDERFPADFVNKLLDSDNRIGVWREYRGLTMSALAEAAGISQSYLSDIENGKKDGSVKVLKRIAQALNTDVDLIVSAPAQPCNTDTPVIPEPHNP